MSTKHTVFDSRHLPRALELDDWEVLEDFYITFLQQLEEFLQLVDSAVSPMGLEEQRHHAHKLGSSCRTVGATALASLLEKLEELCRSAADADMRSKLLTEIAGLGANTRDQVASHLSAAGGD
ncbi:Hpt domain-containing protein [Haliea sp.]|jgi:HPt (histidine-containing phosphotransfer) domain-containing protein|uniref:Hpt domain-containing protein n=1 Tax=Haliea sp. TaxID=1932666 RepID=UPI0035290427